MIEGRIADRGVPVVEISFVGRTWTATSDTGFNGHLEMPEDLRYSVAAQFLGISDSLLAGGRVVSEYQYAVKFPFDGELLRVRATFAPGDGILNGTRILMSYRLIIDFPDRRLWLEQE